MGQSVIPGTVNQTLLFPPSLHDWLPEGHLVRFLLDVVSALKQARLEAGEQKHPLDGPVELQRRS